MKFNSSNLNLNLRHLQTLQKIWSLGSFRRAAVDLGVVPSALTETVRQMEEALGAPLFDRSQRPPVPTPLALSLLRETAPLLIGLDHAITKARAVAGLQEGYLAVGSAPSAISELIGPALARFRARHPGIRCLLRDDVAEKLAELVAEGSLDLAVAGRANPSPGIGQEFLMRDRFGVACAVNHRFAHASAVSLKDIDPTEVISLDQGTGTQQILLSTPEVPAALQEGCIRAHSTIAQLSMIRAGLGVGLLPRNAVALFGDPAICFVSLADLDLWRSLYLLEPADRAPSHIARVFAQDVRFVLSNMGPAPESTTHAKFTCSEE